MAGAALEPAIPRLSKEKPFEFFAKSQLFTGDSSLNKMDDLLGLNRL